MKPELIVMIGYRGAGKSSLAQKLSKRLGWEYVSSDAEIEKEVGPLSEWVPRMGWEKFRERENRICRELAERKQTVLDLGGGVVENPENFSGFKEKAVILWIDTDIDLLIQRLKRDQHRPLLSHPSSKTHNYHEMLEEETHRKYRERKPLYRRFSHHHIFNNGDLTDAVKTILNCLKTYPAINVREHHGW